MIKVMIVEDETLVRLGLKNSIDWEKHGMVVVADLSNGKAALDHYLSDRPDIIITDIKMPVMDGMRLIEEIRKTDDDTVFVVLTCLEEFGYIKRAMELGVSDYILKLTTTEEELDSLLHKLRNTVEAKRAGGGKALSTAKEWLIKDFIFYNAFPPEDFAAQVEALGLNIRPEESVMALMEVDTYPRLKAAFEDGRGLLTNYALMNIVSEILGKHGEIVHEDGPRYIILLNKNGKEEIIGVFRRIIDTAQSLFGVSVSFGVSEARDGFGAMGAMYREAAEALKRRFFFGPGTICGFSDNEEIPGARKAQALRSLYKLFGVNDETLKERFDARISSLISHFPQDPDEVRDALLLLLHWMAEQLYLAGDEIYARLAAHNQAIRRAESLDEAIDELARFAVAARDLGRGRHRSEVSRALRFIAANYRSDISLQSVARHVNLSPGYFSALFKKEVGAPLTEYLSNVRVEEAKRLLRGTDLKAYEISERVGFRESTYFSTAFKKATGVSPNQYRDMWLGREAVEDEPVEENHSGQ